MTAGSDAQPPFSVAVRAEQQPTAIARLQDVSSGSDSGVILVDVIDPQGIVVWANQAQCELSGQPTEDVIGKPLEAIYAAESAREIRALLANPPQDARLVPMELALRRPNGRNLPVIAAGRFRRMPTSDAWELQFNKIDFGPMARRFERLETDNRVLRSIVQDAQEAHWCIEFTEPVDIGRPDEEIVDQVFSNPSIWRMCNRAMAQLYQLPEHLELNDQSVRLYWPRSPANEAFVRQIISSGFAVNNAISVDRRHDGSSIFIDNDVRADIRDGWLLRIWGNCRNISPQRDAQNEAEKKLLSWTRVFNAMPQAVLVLDGEGGTIWRNTGFQRLFGQAEAIAAQFMALAGKSGWHMAALTSLDGLTRNYSFHLDRVLGDDDQPWIVIAIDHKSQAPSSP